MTHRLARRQLPLCSLVAAAVATALVFAPAALATHAAGTPSSTTLTVAKQGPGTVTGDGIDCGTDCAETYPADDFCTDNTDGGGNHAGGSQDCSRFYGSNSLTAAGSNGYVFDHWEACDSAPTVNPCEVSEMQQPGTALFDDRTVTAHFRDDTDPVVTPSWPDAGAEIGGTSYLVGASATDNSGSLNRIELFVRLDDNPVAVADRFGVISGASGMAAWDTRTLPNGTPVPNGSTARITVRAFDGAGRTGSVTRSFVVDNAVSVAIAQRPAEFTNAGSEQLTFTGDPDIDSSTGYTCTTLRGGTEIETGSCSSPYSVPVASEGAYEVRVRGVDNQGNEDMDTDTFVVDRTVPVVTLTTPADGSTRRDGFTPVYSVSDANPNPSSDQCRLDGDVYGACGAVATPPDGAHSFSVRTADKAGNVGDDGNTFTIDTAAPSLSITGGPSQNEIIGTSGVAFSFSSGDPTPPVTRQCRVYRAGSAPAFGNCTSNTSHSASGLGEGAYVFEVRATDGVGNQRVARRDFVVNAVRPAAQITGGPAEGAVVRSSTTTISFTASGGTVQCSLDSETAFRACSGPGSDALTGLADGAHTFRVRVRDETNDQVVRSRTFRVDTSVPPPARPPIILEPPIKELLKQILNPSLSTKFDAFRGYTIYRRLALRAVPAGAKVSITCKGRKCPARRSAKLRKFTKKRLRAGTTLTISVTKPGTIGKRFTIKIRKGKAPKLRISQIA